MRYAVGIGSNRGPRATIIAAAAAAFDAAGCGRVVARSPLITTAPIGGPRGQKAFLNGVWLVESPLGPHQLLVRFQILERDFGRVRAVPGGARTLDCDLLLREDGACCCTPVLTLPHPRVHQRRFVLEPLSVVAGSWCHPWFGCTIAELWHSFPGVVG